MGVLAAQPSDVPPLRALQAAVLEVAAGYATQRDAILLRHRVVSATPSLTSRVAERHHSWESAVITELRRRGRGAGMPELTLRLSVAAATTALRVATELWVEGDGKGDAPSGVLGPGAEQRTLGPVTASPRGPRSLQDH